LVEVSTDIDDACDPFVGFEVGLEGCPIGGPGDITADGNPPSLTAVWGLRRSVRSGKVRQGSHGTTNPEALLKKLASRNPHDRATENPVDAAQLAVVSSFVSELPTDGDVKMPDDDR
jgi:hypothetical protein